MQTEIYFGNPDWYTKWLGREKSSLIDEITMKSASTKDSQNEKILLRRLWNKNYNSISLAKYLDSRKIRSNNGMEPHFAHCKLIQTQ